MKNAFRSPYDGIIRIRLKGSGPARLSRRVPSWNMDSTPDFYAVYEW